MATFSLILCTSAVTLAYLVGLAIHRLYISPLAKFPGPKLAALTKWYEAYYEIILNGRFSFHIEDLHRQYGPIVRITPFEVHIQDPAFYETLYVKHNKSDKYDWTSGRFGNAGSVFTTASSSLHKVRRQPLNNMFSRRAIIAFEPEVQKKLDIFCRGLDHFKTNGAVCKISEAFSAFAGDVVTNYSFGFDYDHLSLPGFTDSFHDPFMAVSAAGHVALQFPIMHPILHIIPDRINKALNPPLAKMLDLQRDLRKKIARVRKGLEDGEKLPENATIFHTLLQSDILPEQEKSNPRLGEEAQLILGAGVETTAWALSNAAYYILSNSQLLHNLKCELREAIPDVFASGAFSYDKLESLPYLRGCIKEAIRLSLGVSCRNPRLLNEPLVWRDWVIPARTPISMTCQDIHYNDDIYPEAMRFKPERWIGEAPKAPDGSSLERYFVAFGKGPRQCLGMNLAYMELFLLLGRMFRTYDLELYETDETDILLAHDWLLPSPKLDSKGIRVKVVGKEA